MSGTDFMSAIKALREKDPRYSVDAYFFVREALDFSSKMLNKPEAGPGRHITGQELLEGIRAYALQEFGPMTLTVLNTWGIEQTGDFGEIVFNLIESNRLGKTEEDKKEDFYGGYDFNEAFAKPFEPAGTTRPAEDTNFRPRKPTTDITRNETDTGDQGEKKN